MNGTRTRAWWLVRSELALGIALTLLVAVLGLHAPLEFHFGLLFPIMLGPLALPPSAIAPLGAFAIAISGLVWMVRITRGPGDDPPPRWRYREVNWRYRDR